NQCPSWVIPSIAEWSGGLGSFCLEENSRIIVEREEQGRALWDVAMLLHEYCEKDRDFRAGLTVCRGTQEDARRGDIYLGYAEEENGLGEEGYTCDITDKCVIKANTAVGVRWGTVTLLQMMSAPGNRAYRAPQGQIRDYPLYEVRGFGIDVARKAVSLDTLYEMMETMSWYKMNDLTIHLNDNEILATSGLTDSAAHAMTAKSAFRLESSLTGGEGKTLTSQEYAYTKDEFAQFIATARSYGVTVVPEIDTPAHSLSITKLYPEYALHSANESVDQIDLANENAVAFVEKIWQEALDEEQGAFREAQIIGIGMDEYYGDGEQYRQYLTRINDLVQESGKTVRLWGSLSNMGGTTKPLPENLQMNIWSTVWADPREMYEAGYSLINMQNNHLYIIPGGGYDYLDSRELYENWRPNRFYDYNRIETVPAYSPQMLGAVYMIWNDMCGSLDMGMTEYDLYERFLPPLGILSVRLWGEEHFANDQSSQESYLYDMRVAVEPGYKIAMKVYLEPDGKPEQVLAEGDWAYGEWAFYAAEPETGKVGFTREGKTYTFDYTLPRGEWVNLWLEGRSGQTTLYVEGEEVDCLGSNEPFEEHATFVFPMQRVGTQTARFDGELELQVVWPK
ncbi:MAG: family 20 glycosylhydrolase, partial [Lachnospiraceae bacterium]|nr:family 20 glycosylhydrolase [Lachnospiraceae bacterium]